MAYGRNNTYTHTHTYTADSPFNATLWSVVIVILLLLGAITLAAIVVLVLWIRYAVVGDQRTTILSVPFNIDLADRVGLKQRRQKIGEGE